MRVLRRCEHLQALAEALGHQDEPAAVIHKIGRGNARREPRDVPGPGPQSEAGSAALIQNTASCGSGS
jgi:hypothetical protein